MSYTGSVELISGITPKNGRGFPLVNAPDVYVDETHRLPDALSDLHEDINDKVSGLRSDLSDVGNEIADLRSDLSDVGNEIADLRGDLSDVGDEVADLRGDLSHLENDGTSRLNPSIFGHGGLNLNTGGKINGYDYRVVSIKNIVYGRNITLTPVTGFRFYFLCMSGDSPIASDLNGWKTESLSVPSNQAFRVLIAKEAATEDTTIIADIKEFVDSIIVSTFIKEIDARIETVETNLNNIRPVVNTLTPRVESLESIKTYLIEPFDSSHNYEVGDFVSNNGKVYTYTRIKPAGTSWQSAYVCEVTKFTELYRNLLKLNYSKKVYILSGHITHASANNYRNIPQLSDATPGKLCMFCMIGDDATFPSGYRVLSNSGSVYPVAGSNLLNVNQTYIVPLQSAYTTTSFGPYLNANDTAQSVDGEFTFIFAYDVEDTPNGALIERITTDKLSNLMYGPSITSVFNLASGNRDARTLNPQSIKTYAGKSIKFLVESNDDTLSFRVFTSDNIPISEEGNNEYSPNRVYTVKLNSAIANTASTIIGPYFTNTFEKDQLIRFTIWYDIPDDQDLSKYVQKNSSLKGKTLWSIWDSLGENTWQGYFVNNTGCTFFSNLNTSSSKPISKGGTSTNPATDDGGQQRAINLVSLKNDHDIDVIIIENINDIEAVQNNQVGAITDEPFMRSQKITIDAGTESYADTVAYINSNLGTVLAEVSNDKRLPGTVIGFTYSKPGAICGSRVVFTGTTTVEGDITLTWQGTPYAVHATVGMTADEIAEEFSKYSFGSGTTDRYIGNGAIIITYYTETSYRVGFNAGGTGITATVTDSEGRSEVDRFFYGLASEWTDTTKWASSCSLYSQYKGLIEYLLRNLPNADIFWCIPFAIAMNFSDNTYKRSDGTWNIDKINSEYPRARITKQLFEAQRNVCDMYGIPILDVEKEAGVNYANIETYYNSSNVHPKAIGYKKYADVMTRLIGQLV